MTPAQPLMSHSSTNEKEQMEMEQVPHDRSARPSAVAGRGSLSHLDASLTFTSRSSRPSSPLSASGESMLTTGCLDAPPVSNDGSSAGACVDPPPLVMKSIKELVEAAHDGRLTREGGRALLRAAVLRDAAPKVVEPTDVLDHLPPTWAAEVARVRSKCDTHQGRSEMRILSTHKHLAELQSFDTSADMLWLGIVGLLDAVLSIRNEVTPGADAEYVVAGTPAIPLLHTPHSAPPSLQLPLPLCIFRGLMPRPECGGPFRRDYPPYRLTWEPQEHTAREPHEPHTPQPPLPPPPIALPHRAKLTSMWATLAQVTTACVRSYVDEIDGLCSPSPLSRMHGLVRALWSLLHIGSAYYLTPCMQLHVYGTASCRGVHGGSWFEKERRQANLVEAHGFAPSSVTYTDMIIASVFNIPAHHRKAYTKVGTGNDTGDVNWSQSGAWLAKHGSEMSRGELCRKLSRSSACFDAMAGLEALVVLDSDGSPDHEECMQFMTSHDMWDSKLFNPNGESPLTPRHEDAWTAHPLLKPWVKRVLVDVIYTSGHATSAIVDILPNSNVLGKGSVRAIIVLYSIPRPGLPPRLVLACHKCDGKGSGSGGHFMGRWRMRTQLPLATLVAGLAEHMLGVKGWGSRMLGAPPPTMEALPLKSACFAFPASMLSHHCTREFPPYTMNDVLLMDSIAPRVSNSVSMAITHLPPPPPRMATSLQQAPLATHTTPTQHAHSTRLAKAVVVQQVRSRVQSRELRKLLT